MSAIAMTYLPLLTPLILVGLIAAYIAICIREDSRRGRRGK
jgi:hypothetical protein